MLHLGWSVEINFKKGNAIREVSKYGVFPGPYFPVFKPEKPPYLEMPSDGS